MGGLSRTWKEIYTHISTNTVCITSLSNAVDGFVGHTEQLSVYETCQEEEADGGGLQQSSALEQRGGEDAVLSPVMSPGSVSHESLCAHQAVCGYGAQDALPFRSAKEGELFFIEDRDINLVELALATNIPKGCAETLVRGKTHRCCFDAEHVWSGGMCSRSRLLLSSPDSKRVLPGWERKPGASGGR